MPDFDLTVVGSGPGGYVAAIHAARLGARVVILEEDANRWGGTCLNWGCIPTKALIHGAEVLETVRRAAEFGVRAGEPEVDWPAMQRRKDEVVRGLRRGVQGLLAANRVETVVARGRLLPGGSEAERRVAADGREIGSRAVLLAPGSAVAVPAVAGVELALTSDTILGLDRVPDSLVVVGGGVVGMEFATLFNLLGSRVTVVEMLDRLLVPLDREVAERFQQLMSRRRIEIHLGARLESIEPAGSFRRVRFSGGEVVAEAVLVATGRRPNTADMGLEGSVALDRGAIRVDQHLRTSLPGVYAIGDATGISMLAHTASYQGEVAVANALGEKRITADYGVIPACIYTQPEIAWVGLAEEQARDQGEQVRVGRFPFSALGRAAVLGETDGLVKLVASSDGTLLGATIMGPRATDLVAEVALALGLGITAAELASVVHAHPTLPEAVAEAALDVAGRAVHVPPRRRPVS